MSTYAEILQAALALPPSERGTLAETLLESVGEESSNGEQPEELSAACAKKSPGAPPNTTPAPLER